MSWWKITGWPHLRAGLLVLASAFAEKSPKKQLYDDIPVVLSATRIIVYIALGVWAAMGLAATGMPAWPFFTFGSILIMALPILSALTSLAETDPAAVIDFAKDIYSRLGVGDTKGDIYKQELITKQIIEHRDHEAGIDPTAN